MRPTSHPPLRILLRTVAATVVLFAGVYALDRTGFSTVGNLTGDPAATLDAPLSLGAISHLGVLTWATAAGICLFTWYALRQQHSDSERVRFLLWAGVLTAVLCLDDLFLIHERVGPRYLGVPEHLVYGTYAAGAVLLLLRFRTTVLGTEILLLLSAGGAFAASIFVDSFPELLFPGTTDEYLVEDGTKLLGIFLWATYLIRTAATAVGIASDDPHPIG